MPSVNLLWMDISRNSIVPGPFERGESHAEATPRPARRSLAWDFRSFGNPTGTEMTTSPFPLALPLGRGR